MQPEGEVLVVMQPSGSLGMEALTLRPLPAGEGTLGASRRPNTLRERGDDLLAEELERLLGQLLRHAADAVLGEEDVVPDPRLLLLQQADDGLRPPDQGQAVVDPEVVGLGRLLEDAGPRVDLSPPLAGGAARVPAPTDARVRNGLAGRA